MTDTEGLITPEARASIGREAPPVTGYEVTAHEIRRYCYAIDDLNPLYCDEAGAAAGPYGGIIAPPLFLSIPFARDVPLHQIRHDGIPLAQEGVQRPPLRATRTMAGGTEIEFREPVRPGDVLTRRQRIADVYEREGRSGPMAFTVTEWEEVEGGPITVPGSAVVELPTRTGDGAV